MKSLSSSLQSRIAKRANMLSGAEGWKAYHKAQQQMKDYQQCKGVINLLAQDQQLDKRLLKIVREYELASETLPEWWEF